jgi:hypothetical protein
MAEFYGTEWLCLTKLSDRIGLEVFGRHFSENLAG